MRLRSVFFKTIYTKHSKFHLWINCVSRANYTFWWLLKIAFISQFFSLLQIKQDFPSGSVDRNLPGSGFDLWPRKVPHAVEHLSPCTTRAEPVLRADELQLPSPRATATELVCGNYWSPRGLSPWSLTAEAHDKPLHQHEGQPRLTTTREILRKATKTQCSQSKSTDNILKTKLNKETLLHSSKETSTEKRITSVK